MLVMLPVIPVIPALLYVLRYRHNNNPPTYDVISPCVTLSICYTIVSSYGVGSMTVVLCCGLVMDAIADLLMHNYPLRTCLLIFSFGHLVKQLVATMTMEPSINYDFVVGLYFLNMALILSLTLAGPNSKQSLVIGCYSGIILGTLVSLSVAKQTIDLGYICYAISDLIIGYELTFHNIHPRYLRVLGVPMLYWLSQYLTARHLLLKQ